MDDDENHLVFTKLFMEQNNPSFKVTSIDSPERALEELEKNSYDCVVSDYNMPGMDGLQLAGKIREINGVPIILYTGQGSEEVAEQAFSAGVDGYIRKELHPANYHVLGMNIQNVVDRDRAKRLLMESERRYRKLVEDSPLPISVTSGDRIVYVNQKRVELTGHEAPGSIVGSSGLAAVHPEDKKRLLERLRARAEGREVSPVNVFRLRRVDGSIIHVEDHMSDTVWDGLPAVLHSLVDFTERVRYEEQLKAMHSYGAKLAKARDVSEVAEISLRAAESLMGFSSASFGVVEADELVFTHVLGLESFTERAYRLDGPGITVRAVNTGETQHVTDTRLDPDYISSYADELRKVHLSELDVPVTVDGEAVAVISLGHERVDGFTCKDVRLLELLAAHVASAFERLHGEERRRMYTGRLEALLRCSARLAAAETREEVYDVAIGIMEEGLGYSWVGVGLVDDGCLRYVRANVEEYLGASLPLDGPGVTVRAANTGSTQLVRDTRLEPEYVLLEGYTEPNLSELAVPVTVDGEVKVVLNLESDGLDDFNLDDIRLMELFSMHLASTLRNIMALEERRTYEARLRALNRFGAEVERCASVEEIAGITMSSVQSIFNYTTGSFGVVEDGEIRFVELMGPTVTPRIRVDQKGVTARAVRTRRTQLVPDVRLDPDYLDGRVEGEETLSELDVPVLVDGRPVALINLESERPGFFGEADADLVEIMAEHVASALRNISLMEERSYYSDRCLAYARKLEALHVHAHEMDRADSVEQVAELTVAALRGILDFEYCSFSVVEGCCLNLKHKSVPGSISKLSLDGSGVTVRAVRTGEAQLVPDVRLDSDYVGGDNGSILSELAVPVKVEGRVEAVINIESEILDSFTEEDVRLVEILAQCVSSTFARMRSLGKVKAG